MRRIEKYLLVPAVILLCVAFGACKGGPDDATLAANVKAKLTTDAPLSAATINVAAASGVVTLSGTVATEAEKAKAESIASAVEGVKSVTNSISVKPPVINATPPPVTEDTKLKTDVTAALAKYGITGVTVTVSAGEVTLTGDVPKAKLQDAIKAANESHPKKVLNKLNAK
jgi:hyperosmotically inducible protein